MTREAPELPLHAKGRLIAKASLKGHAIKLCSCFNKNLTDWMCSSVCTDVILGLRRTKSLPSVHVIHHVFKETSLRRMKKAEIIIQAEFLQS